MHGLFLYCPTESICREYCAKIGVTFEPQMLNWDNEAENASLFQQWMPWFEGVLTSNTFQPSMTKPHTPKVLPELPRHVQQAIDDSRVYYRQMYDVRLRPETLVV